MEDFGLKVIAATFYVILGGGLLTWGVHKIVDTLNALTNITLEGLAGATVFVLIIAVVALNL
jgi:hypothetical protein|tara:strand:+ start:54 stop:239 length:186 start_codon:yes stop_codon:yes gene_type:complete